MKTQLRKSGRIIISALAVATASLFAQEPLVPETSGPVSVGIIVPQSLKLDQVISHPNYHGRQAVQLTLSEPQEITVSLRDVNGKTIRLLFSGKMAAGTHFVMLPEKKMPRGEYFCYLEGNDVDIKRLVLARPPRAETP